MWFITTMGTGMASLLLRNFPYPAYWLQVCSYIMFTCCCLLFIFLNIICILSWIFFPSKIKEMFLDATQSSFWGCYSMGLSSILSYLHSITGTRWVTAIFALWIINVTISLATSNVIIFLQHWRGKFEPSQIQISILLPAVSQNVIAATGGVLYSSTHHNLKLFTIIASYLCWANGIALTGWICALYFWKLYIHTISTGYNMGFMALIPVGAFGQGAYAALLAFDNFADYVQVVNPNFLNFKNEATLIPYTNFIVGQGLRCVGLFVALFLVSNGIFFTINGILNVYATRSNGFCKFWWSSTFPLGTMALATRELYRTYGLGAFRVVSVIYATAEIIMTLTCLCGSLIYDFPHDIYRPLADDCEVYSSSPRPKSSRDTRDTQV